MTIHFWINCVWWWGLATENVSLACILFKVINNWNCTELLHWSIKWTDEKWKYNLINSMRTFLLYHSDCTSRWRIDIRLWVFFTTSIMKLSWKSNRCFLPFFGNVILMNSFFQRREYFLSNCNSDFSYFWEDLSENGIVEISKIFKMNWISAKLINQNHNLLNEISLSSISTIVMN